MAAKKQDPAKKAPAKKAPAKKAPAKKAPAKKAPAKKAAATKNEKEASAKSIAELKSWISSQRALLQSSTDAAVSDARSSSGDNKPLSTEQKKLQEKRREILSIRREARNPTQKPYAVAGRALSGKTVSETDAEEAATAAAAMEEGAAARASATNVVEPEARPRNTGPTAPLEDIRAAQAERTREEVRQGVKGRGRVVRKRRGKGSNIPRTAVSNPMTLRDINENFMYLLYDPEKPIYNEEGDLVGLGGRQDPPAADVSAETRFHVTDDPENRMGAHTGLPTNEFRTVTVARENEKVSEAVARTEKLAQVSEDLARFAELDKPVAETNEEGRTSVRNPARSVAYRLANADQSTGQGYGIKPAIRRKNEALEAAGTMSYLRSAVRRGALRSGGTLRQARALRSTRPSLELENAQRDLDLGREGADERVSHLSSQLDEASREIGARTGADALIDFAEKLRTVDIPDMNKPYNPVEQGINVEGGYVQVSDIVPAAKAAEMAEEATTPQWIDRSRTLEGPTAFADYTHPSDFVRPGSIARLAVETLNQSLRRMEPGRAAALAADYVDYANVGPGIATGSPSMKLPADAQGNPIRGAGGSPLPPERVSLVSGLTPTGTVSDKDSSPFKLSKLDPDAREQVDAVDESNEGVAGISRAMSGIRRDLKIPKRYGRGIPSDALIFTRREGMRNAVERDLMGRDDRYSGDVTKANLKGKEALIRAATPQDTGWLGTLNQNSKTGLTPGEMAELPTGEPVTHTSLVQRGSQGSPTALRAVLGLAHLLSGGTFPQPTREEIKNATDPRHRYARQTTTIENPPNLYDQIDKVTGNFPVRSFKMDSPEGTGVPPHLGGQFSGQ